jgi:hypothetical protein
MNSRYNTSYISSKTPFSNTIICLHREHPASEVFVTGTFDDWKQTEQLQKKGDIFEKEVTLPSAADKIYYKVRRDSCGVQLLYTIRYIAIAPLLQ